MPKADELSGRCRNGAGEGERMSASKSAFEQIAQHENKIARAMARHKEQHKVRSRKSCYFCRLDELKKLLARASH